MRCKHKKWIQNGKRPKVYQQLWVEYIHTCEWQRVCTSDSLYGSMIYILHAVFEVSLIYWDWQTQALDIRSSTCQNIN